MISPYVYLSYVSHSFFVKVYLQKSRSTKRVQDLLVRRKSISLGILWTGISPSPFYLRMESLLPTHPGVQRLVFLLLSHVDHLDIVRVIGQINDLYRPGRSGLVYFQIRSQLLDRDSTPLILHQPCGWRFSPSPNWTPLTHDEPSMVVPQPPELSCQTIHQVTHLTHLNGQSPGRLPLPQQRRGQLPCPSPQLFNLTMKSDQSPFGLLHLPVQHDDVITDSIPLLLYHIHPLTYPGDLVHGLHSASPHVAYGCLEDSVVRLTPFRLWLNATG